MGNFRIWAYGQSNMVWLNNTTPGSPINDTMLPALRQLVDPAGTEATLSVQYDLNGTCFSGTGSGLTNAAMPLQADGTYGTASSVCLVRPRAPSDPQFTDWANWPLTNLANARITYANGLSAAIKAEVSCILAMHSEYDTRGYAVNGWAQNDSRVVEFAWRRMIGALRAALGKTPAQLPLLATIAVPYTPGSDDGFDATTRAILALAGDAAFNLRIICEQTMDMTWDRDGPAGAYTWHANNDDLTLLARRIARGIAREMGPAWAPNGFRSRPSVGPVAYWVQRVDDASVDVWVRHDGGNTLRLSATPTLGWQARYNGRPVAVSAAAVQPDNRRIRLTLAEPCPSHRLLTVAYGWGNTRLLPGGGIYDDAAGFDAKAIAAGISGAERIDDALRRTRTRLAVHTTAPTN